MEKIFNKKTGNWEINGEPVTYKVTWKNTDDGKQYVEEFTSIDHGYDFYKSRQKCAFSINVTWEHAPW